MPGQRNRAQTVGARRCAVCSCREEFYICTLGVRMRSTRRPSSPCISVGLAETRLAERARVRVIHFRLLAHFSCSGQIDRLPQRRYFYLMLYRLLGV